MGGSVLLRGMFEHCWDNKFVPELPAGSQLKAKHRMNLHHVCRHPKQRQDNMQPQFERNGKTKEASTSH